MTQRIFSNQTNQAKDATITSTNLIASQSFRRTTRTQDGGGTIGLSGSYTGGSDVDVEIEIRNDTITGTPLISEAISKAIGSGTISSISATSGTAAQSITVTLSDLGTKTRKAYANFGPVTLEAKTAGTGGNDITVTVDRSGLSFSASDYAVPEDISGSETEYTGAGWNFDAANLDAEGKIPDTAPRIRFRGFPTIYRQYREFVRGEYIYKFTPNIKESIPRGTVVEKVTGTYSVSVKEDATTETTASVQTLFDFLDDVQANSTLVDVVGVVKNDKLPGGMGIDDLNLFTESYVSKFMRSRFDLATDISVVLDTDAKGQDIRITCKDNAIVGSEQWEVQGDVDGTLNTRAVSGVAYDNGPIKFTVPKVVPDGTPPDGRIQADLQLTSRSKSDAKPVLCLDKMRAKLGALAVNGKYTFTYRNRVQNDCDCGDITTTGVPDNVCLGLSTTGDDTVAALPAAYKSNLQTLYNWRETYIKGNTSLLAETTTVAADSTFTGNDLYTEAVEEGSEYATRKTAFSAVLKVDRVDIEACDEAVEIFHDTIKKVYAETGGTGSAWTSALAEWDTEVTNLATDFDPTDGLVGAEWWRLFSESIQISGDDQPNSAQIAQIGQDILREQFDVYMKRYKAIMDTILITADIEPTFDLASREGGRCWRDRPTNAWWVSAEGLLPAFTNHGYHSARRVEDDDGDLIVVSTQEFFFIPAIACEDKLRDGDRIVITIEDVNNQTRPYQVGDQFTVSCVSAAAIELGGGQTGNDTLTWTVLSSTQSMPDYSLDTGSPAAYNQNGISFLINTGNIDFALGDQFSFSVEGGQFRWRIDSGSWSSDTQIAASVSLQDGLNATFTPGTAPSFVANDKNIFKVEAVNGPGRALKLTDVKHEWSQSTNTITLTGFTGNVDSLVLVHSLKSGTNTISIEGSDDSFATSPLDESLTITDDVLVYHFSASQTYDDYRLVITGAGSIDWIYLGQPWAPERPAEFVRRDQVQYQGAGVNENGISLGKGVGGRLAMTMEKWTKMSDLMDNINYAFENDLGRLVFQPHFQHVDEAFLCRFDQRDYERRDIFDYHPDDKGKRVLALNLNLAPVFR